MAGADRGVVLKRWLGEMHHREREILRLRF